MTTTLDRVTQLNAGNVRAPLGGYVLGRGMAVYGKGGKRAGKLVSYLAAYPPDLRLLPSH